MGQPPSPQDHCTNKVPVSLQFVGTDHHIEAPPILPLLNGLRREQPQEDGI